MNITKFILKNKSIKIIADDNTVVNNQTLEGLIKKNLLVLQQNNIKRNDNVAIVLNNSIDFVVSFFSIVNVAVSAPLNPNYTEAEFSFYFKDLKPKVVICNFEDSHPAVICAKKNNIRVIKIEEFIFKEALNKKSNLSKKYKSDSKDIALILHTSGTTSRPKMVPLTHKNLIKKYLFLDLI